jgi:hypothetical protein
MMCACTRPSRIAGLVVAVSEPRRCALRVVDYSRHEVAHSRRFPAVMLLLVIRPAIL